jgi:hypothetical protein
VQIINGTMLVRESWKQQQMAMPQEQQQHGLIMNNPSERIDR